MKIAKHLDKNNLHHAYLIEGLREEIVPELFSFFGDMNIETSGNPDFYNLAIDSFKIDDAFSLRVMSNDKSFTVAKKIFIISINNITLDAQSVLLKMFEEPIDNTHFFLIVPDANSLLKTLVSRFYIIRPAPELRGGDLMDAEKFIKMPVRNRIDFIKDLLVEPDGEDAEGNEITVQDSARSQALKFLNALEFTLHKRIVSKAAFDTGCFEHFFKVREFLRMPGSSVKNLMESVALIMPITPNI